MPAGAVGLWYADQYSSATNAIPNSALTTLPKANWLRLSRRMFASTVIPLWGSTGLTITDDAAVAWDGTTEASTIVGAGDWIFYPTLSTVPAGTYTVACYVKSNTGANQQFKIGDFNSTLSATKTATTSWQRFSQTFTTTGNVWPMLVSFDRVTGASLQVIDFELFSGSTDLGPVGADGHLYLGPTKSAAAPTVTTNLVDLSTGGYGLIQLPAAQTISTGLAAMAVIQKTAAASSYHSFLSKIQAFADFSAMTEQGGSAFTYINGGGGAPSTLAGLWTMLNAGYHVITLNVTTTSFEIWMDDTKLLTKTGGFTSFIIRDLSVGITGVASNNAGEKFNSIALYPTSLSAPQIRSAVTALRMRASADGVTMASTRILVAEGDSITGNGVSNYPWLYGPNSSPILQGNVAAVSGAVVGLPGDSSATNSLYGRAAAVDATLPTTLSGKYILSVLIGRNDVQGYAGGTSAWLANLAVYLDARRAAGWKVALCTILPSTTAGFNAIRNTANTELRLWATNGSVVPGKHADYIVDFAGDATMGIDGNGTTTGPWNTTYYSDGTHPTAAGQAILETVFRPVVNAI